MRSEAHPLIVHSFPGFNSQVLTEYPNRGTYLSNYHVFYSFTHYLTMLRVANTVQVLYPNLGTLMNY